ncbi:MAG TPA: polysaccharide biosynthesis C-terminal domain-containing protein, partial [Planctomycetota bacterium]|nr:polysaccharide biosynthesis C-terminal domain-containing protein [Planctomycetota bacterium]
EDPGETPVASLAKHSLVYSVAPLIQKFIALTLVWIYTRELNNAQLGATAICDLLFTALIQICGTNLLGAIVRFYFEQKDERDRRAVISSAMLFLSVVSWSIVALGFVFRAPLAEALFVVSDRDLAQDDLTLCLSVVLATIPLALCSETAFRYLQIQQRSRLITTIRVSKALLEMALRVVFLVHFHYGVIGFLLATLIGELLTNVLLTVWVLRRVGLKFSKRVLSPMIAYGAPLVLVGLCQMALNRIDSQMLRQLGPEDDAMGWAGIYNHGYAIGWLVQLVVVGSFMQIWQPWIFAVKDAERRVDLVAKVSTWALFAVAVASIGLMLFGREFVHILTAPGKESLWAATPVLTWVCAGYVFFALNALSQVPMFIAKRTWPMFWLNVIAVVVKVGLCFALIPRLGFVGAAVATLATFVILGIAGHVVASRTVGARFEHGRMAAMLILVLGVMAATLWIDGSLSQAYVTIFTPMTGVKAALFVVIALAVWGLFLHPDERAQLTRRVRAKLRASGP